MGETIQNNPSEMLRHFPNSQDFLGNGSTKGTMSEGLNVEGYKGPRIYPPWTGNNYLPFML